MITPTPALLTASAPVPIDRPFTSSWAKAEGINPRQLRAWVQAGLLLSPVRGVLYAAQLHDCVDLRLACLRPVVPDHAVVTDRTAAWLHGAPMVLAPNSHLQMPAVDMFLLPGGRIRRGLVRSGQRELFVSEIEEIDGVRVTTQLRTMCDLGTSRGSRHSPRCACS